MFTGIVTDTGKIISRTVRGDSIIFFVQPGNKNYLINLKEGNSIAINGACMTIEKTIKNQFRFTTVKESLGKTNLSSLEIGEFVNLEKPIKLKDTLDGHIVQGHIDNVGVVSKIIKLKDSWEYYIQFSSRFRDNIIYVGSIAVNGVSLTIADIVKETSRHITIKIAIIPHTYNVTNFKYLKVSDKVNIEFDMLGKYVKRIVKKSIK